jgi:hypothetical protein
MVPESNVTQTSHDRWVYSYHDGGCLLSIFPPGAKREALVERFIERYNIARLTDQLRTETDHRLLGLRVIMRAK